MTPERKLKYLQEYMNLWIDRKVEDTLDIHRTMYLFTECGILWKPKPKPELKQPFSRWLESTLDKRIHKGEKKAEQHKKSVCLYCRRSFDNAHVDKTRDHVVPLSKGGLDLKENRVFACYDCNQWKSDKTLEVWLKEVQAYIKKGKVRIPYQSTTLGLIVGGIKQVMKELKEKPKSKVSVYKV